MLNKLLKYDIKWLSKVLVPAYIIILGLAIFTRILTELTIKFPILSIISSFTLGLFVVGCIIIIIYTIATIIKRYVKNLFKDESYLTHTLPVKRNALLLSKVLSGILYIVFSCIIVFISLGIVFYSKENFNLIQNFVTMQITCGYSISTVLLVILVIIFISLIMYMLLFFAGITLGYRKNSNKNIYSIIYCAILYIVTQIINLIWIGTLVFSTPELIKMKEISNTDLSMIISIALITSIIYMFIYYIITIKVLNKNVNIE